MVLQLIQSVTVIDSQLDRNPDCQNKTKMHSKTEVDFGISSMNFHGHSLTYLHFSGYIGESKNIIKYSEDHSQISPVDLSLILIFYASPTKKKTEAHHFI